MNELEQKYQKKQEILKGIKELYYSDKKLFKKHFCADTLHNQANLLSYLQINDSKFYKEVYNYIFGEKKNDTYNNI